LCAALSLACGNVLAGAGPIEYLDENTGATVTAVERPLVFALERSDVAANLRDYVTLAAAAVNRGGKVQYLLIAYRWSTLDPRARADAATAQVPLVLAADDRRIRLAGSGQTPHDMGVDRLIHPPPKVVAEPVVVSTDLGTLRFIAAARGLSVMADPDPAAPRYELWEDRRAAWSAFVGYMAGER
jgi:hypothetical protein